jgi:hypothetical protein
MTSTNELLSKLFADTYDGQAWHGPSLRSVIDGVNATEAIHQSGHNMHSIVELVHHSAYWMSVVRHWLTGDDVTPDQTTSWGPGGSDAEAVWQQAKESLATEYLALSRIIKAFPEAKLAEVAHEESGLTYYALIHHNIYHSGQIMLLKKMQGNEA